MIVPLIIAAIGAIVGIVGLGVTAIITVRAWRRSAADELAARRDRAIHVRIEDR